MNIYSFPTYNLTKILLTAEEVGQPYTLHLMDFATGEHKSPEHLKRHPLGKVPAVELGGKHYFESNSICRLLAEKNGKLYSGTPEQHAEINQWVDLITQHVGRWLSVLLFEKALKPTFFGEETNQKTVEEAVGFLGQQMPVVEAQICENPFFLGDEITIADTIALSHFMTVEYSGVDLQFLPNIRRWMNDLRQRPSFKTVMAQMPGNELFHGLEKVQPL